MILGVCSSPAVGIPGKLGVQQDVNPEIRTESTNTGFAALRQSRNIILEPPEDDSDLSVPVVSRPGIILSQLLVTLSLHWLRMTKQLQVLRFRLQRDTETNQ